jgi:hypothetical protein
VWSSGALKRTDITALYHIIGFILILGYGEAYYFHLRMVVDVEPRRADVLQATTRTTPTRRLDVVC